MYFLQKQGGGRKRGEGKKDLRARRGWNFEIWDVQEMRGLDQRGGEGGHMLSCTLFD